MALPGGFCEPTSSNIFILTHTVPFEKAKAQFKL